MVETKTNHIVSQHKNRRLALDKAERLNVEAAAGSLLREVRKEVRRCGYQDDRYELPCAAPATVTHIETGCTFLCEAFSGGHFLMAHYYQTEARKTYCDVCGELMMLCNVAADYRELQTGYLDELALCPECRREREAPR